MHEICQTFPQLHLRVCYTVTSTQMLNSRHTVTLGTGFKGLIMRKTWHTINKKS